MRFPTVYACIVLSLLAFSEAHAASRELVEVVKPMGLLQFQGIEQSVSLIYDYTGASGGSTNASTNHFQEKYHVGSSIVVLDPELLQLSLGGELGLDQTAATPGGSNYGINYQYLVAASFLPYTPYPVDILSSRTTSLVTTAFLPAYTTTTDTNQLGIRLFNKIVPLSMRYRRTVLDTQGLSQDSVSTTNDVQLNASHNFHDRSVTEISGNYSGTQSSVSGQAPENSRNYSLIATNGTNLDKENKYSLGTSLSVAESIQNLVPQRSASFSENFSALLGKALQGRASYQYNYNRTLGFDNTEQIQKSNTLTASLMHQLFESLATGVNGRYQNQTLNNGTETGMGGGITLTYSKRLPAKSRFTFGVGANRTYVNRDTSTSQLSVRDELHRSVQQGDFITLSTAGNLSLVVSVKSRNPEITYVEGVDYDVSLPLGRIEIRNGGTIVPGTDLFISYILLQNPVLNYYTDGRRVSSTLSLFESRYIISGEMTTQSQTLISGSEANLSLLDSSSLRFRFDANYIFNSFIAEYASIDSGQTKSSYLSGSWRYNKKLATVDVSLNAMERYTMFEAGGLGTKASTANEFTAGGSLSRGIYTWGRLALSLNYANSIGDTGARNFAFLRANLQGRVNALQFSLSGQSSFRLTKGDFFRNDSLNFTITRYF